MSGSALPVNSILAQMCASLLTNPCLVIEAPPGAGKTTRIPLVLLDLPWCTDRVIVLEPRRIAARAAAHFMAARLGEPVGERVGYRIRFEQRVSARTRIEIVTEGILTRLLQDNPLLEGFSAVVFDEFHERHLASDLGLALCRDVQRSVRGDLRLIVMSATLDGARVANYLDAPRLTSAGRSFPVAVIHAPPAARATPDLNFKQVVERALAETPGDVLCFLPGKAEIARAARLLAATGVEVCALHGDLTLEQQARVLAPAAHRRVVLATNVAESSVTLPAVTSVIDSGRAREPRFDPTSGLTRLETVTIAEPSATQRAGRAGRVGPGRCYRLWPAERVLDGSPRAEIHYADLTQFALELAAWGSPDLELLDPAPSAALAQARARLQQLGALDTHGHATAHGKALLALGAHPRLASAMLRAPLARQPLACDVAALIEARDPLRADVERDDDLRSRHTALLRWRRGAGLANSASRAALIAIDRAARQWCQRLGIAPADAEPDDPYAVGNILALAYPERIARRDDAYPERYVLASGRGTRLREASVLAGSAWLVVSDLRVDARDSRILRAAPCDLDFLRSVYHARFTRDNESAFDSERRAVETAEIECFDAIVLARKSLPTARSADTARALENGILGLGLEVLPWTECLREWQARVAKLRMWCPELGLPDVSDTALLDAAPTWLTGLASGHTRVADITPQALADALYARLDHAQRRAVDDYAPTELRVPSGMRRALSYRTEGPPVLRVKLQELFGLAETPRIARGRVAVMLHLLSPRMTPIQVTQDLKSFWTRTYPEVKKELKGRYPKHPWPDDPWTAQPTHRTKPRTP